MVLYQTEKMKKAAEEPTQLDVERIIAQRSSIQTTKERNKWKWLEAGEKGEQVVLEYIEQYGKADWVIVRNMWLFNGGPFEADFILLTSHTLYLFEVKNYSSNFIYNNGVASFNGQINSGNPIHQTRRNRINLENICQLYSNQLDVKGALILIGMDNYTEIHSKVEDIAIIKRTDLRHYIQQIVAVEESYQGKPLNKNQLLQQFEKFEIERKYGPENVTKETIKDLRKGIQCPHCDGFGVKINQKLTFCPCGFKENREIAILRTICEYGVLTFNEPLRIKDLLHFFNGEIARDSLRLVLKKHFEEVKKGRYSYFVNKNLPLYKLYDQFNIDYSIHLEMTYQEFEKFKK